MVFLGTQRWATSIFSFKKVWIFFQSVPNQLLKTNCWTMFIYLYIPPSEAPCFGFPTSQHESAFYFWKNIYFTDERTLYGYNYLENCPYSCFDISSKQLPCFLLLLSKTKQAKIAKEGHSFNPNFIRRKEFRKQFLTGNQC